MCKLKGNVQLVSIIELPTPFPGRLLLMLVYVLLKELESQIGSIEQPQFHRGAAKLKPVQESSSWPGL